MVTDITVSRTVGAFPISIGTSIAFEHICGVQSEANPEPKPNQLVQYQQCWINLKTLFRNLIGSIDKNKVNKLMAEEVVDALLQEIDVIQSIINQYSNRTQLVVYVNNYKGIEKRFNMAQVKGDHTELQLHNAAIFRLAAGEIIKQLGKDRIKIFDRELKPDQISNTVIITHIAYDLVGHLNFGSLSLLESHTGVIKGRDKWYTKYYNGKELPPVPFCEPLLPVFGDNEFFRPLKKGAREAVIEIAKKYHWTPVTTREKMLYGINTLTDHYLKAVIQSFFH